MVLSLVASVENVEAFTYTSDADFDEGILVGVEHETTPDQLQLSTEHVTLPFIWVPDYNGTVSKVNTETGDELGRYRVAPHPDCDPSRTTVDLQGNCWVGNRQAGTVVKIGLYEAGQCMDRNGNGLIETSLDLNDDGDITDAEILPWGEDECVLCEVVLITGKEGTYVPGTFTGGYDLDYWSTSPRGLAVDANNNLWAGTWASMKYYYIDGSTGGILRTVDVSPWGHHAYGAVIDRNGVLWSSEGVKYSEADPSILRLDPSTDPPAISDLDMGHLVYGLGLDYGDHLWVSSYDVGALSKVNIFTDDIVTHYKWDLWRARVRGVACTSDNDVWIVSTLRDSVYRYDSDGNLKAQIDVGDEPTGIAVDAAGKVWVCNLDGSIVRIDPETNTVDLTKIIIGSDGHYTYSDMTGIVSRTVTTRIGTWTVVADGEAIDTPWSTISWTNDEPEGTSLSVKVRSSNDQTTWSAWENATNGDLLSSPPDGRYLQVEVTLQTFAGDVSPILYDLTVEPEFIPALAVSVDIKPGSCRNPLNPRSRGVLPVAVLGAEDFDVETIDPETISLMREGVDGGVAPIRWSYEDVATPFEGELCDCHDLNGDGYLDLTLKFNMLELVEKLGLRDVVEEVIPLILTGDLKEEYGGTPIEGQDCVWILDTGKNSEKKKGK